MKTGRLKGLQKLFLEEIKNPKIKEGKFYLGMLTKMHPYRLLNLEETYIPPLKVKISMLNGSNLADFMLNKLDVIQEATSAIIRGDIHISFSIDGYFENENDASIIECKYFSEFTDELLNKTLLQVVFQRAAINSNLSKRRNQACYLMKNGFITRFVPKRIKDAYVLVLTNSNLFIYSVWSDKHDLNVLNFIFEKAEMIYKAKTNKIVKECFFQYCQRHQNTKIDIKTRKTTII